MENNNNKLNISKLLDSKGNDKLLWLQVLKDIISGDDNLNYNIVSKLNQCLIDNENLELAIDIIDFIVDHGACNLIESIASVVFLKNFNRILSTKYKTDRETQKLVVFLIKKWADKYKGKEALKNFKYNYDYMFKNGMYNFFDNNKKFETYLKYITIKEIEMIKKININLNSEKTVFNDPFIDEKIEKDKSENINHEERENIFVNEDAPPSFGEVSNSTYSLLPEELNQNLDNDTKNPPIKHKSSNDAINIDKPNINVQNNIAKNIPIKANDTENTDKNKENINIYKSPDINENIKENNNENNNNKNIKIYKSPDINKDIKEKNDKVEKIYRSPDISQNKKLNENNFNAPNNEGNNNNKNEMGENNNNNMNNINLINNNINFRNNNNEINNIVGNRDFNQMNNYNNNYQYNNNIPYNQFNSGNNNNQINVVNNNYQNNNISNNNQNNIRVFNQNYNNYNMQNNQNFINNFNRGNYNNQNNFNSLNIRKGRSIDKYPLNNNINRNNAYNINYNNNYNNKNNMHLNNNNFSNNISFNDYYNNRNQNNNFNNFNSRIDLGDYRNRNNIFHKGYSLDSKNYNINDINKYKSDITNKLIKYNKIIDQGKYSYQNTYKNDLKNGINEIQREIPKCQNLMNNYQRNNDQYKYETAKKILLDIQQTVSRYNDLMNDKIVQKFVSAF